MFIVGLTGGIATGKSTVVKILKSMGFEIIDSDLIAREVVEPGKNAWKAIRREFGEGVFHADGTLNRPALGQIIFSEPEKRQKLNSITHPEIYKSILFGCLKLFLKGHQFAIIDIPLLYESGKMAKFISKVIVVRCDSCQQVVRLIARDDISEIDAQARIDAQMPLEEKCRLANFVIDNSKDESFTKGQVENIIAELRQSRLHWKFRLFVLGGTAVICGVLGFGAYKLVSLL